MAATNNYTPAELVACVAREIWMRETNYPRWDSKPLDQLSPGRRKEIDMMYQILAILKEQQGQALPPAGEQLGLGL